jgi:hypothetical protein
MPGMRLDSLRARRTTAVTATMSTALTGANNDMDFTAVPVGYLGNLVTVRYVDPGTDASPEVVTVSGSAITVTLRSASSVLSTAAQVKTAIDAEPTAAALVTCANKAANSGAGNVTAMTAQAFAGGRSIFTVGDLAKKANVTDRLIRSLEDGGNCSPSEAQQIADALGTTTANLGGAAL